MLACYKRLLIPSSPSKCLTPPALSLFRSHFALLSPGGNNPGELHLRLCLVGFLLPTRWAILRCGRVSEWQRTTKFVVAMRTAPALRLQASKSTTTVWGWNWGPYWAPWKQGKGVRSHISPSCYVSLESPLPPPLLLLLLLRHWWDHSFPSVEKVSFRASVPKYSAGKSPSRGMLRRACFPPSQMLHKLHFTPPIERPFPRHSAFRLLLTTLLVFPMPSRIVVSHHITTAMAVRDLLPVSSQHQRSECCWNIKVDFPLFSWWHMVAHKSNTTKWADRTRGKRCGIRQRDSGAFALAVVITELLLLNSIVREAWRALLLLAFVAAIGVAIVATCWGNSNAKLLILSLQRRTKRACKYHQGKVVFWVS